MKDASKNRWYVVQTKPLNEDRVCLQFKNASLRGSEATEAIPCQSIETFCPKIKCMSISTDTKIKYKPLFPSYLFLHWDLGNPANHHCVKYTRGVNKVLGEGAEAIPIDDDVIETIKARVNEGGIIEQKTFKVGDQIKVKKGHLRDLIGILERPISDSGRVAVLLNMFNRQMRVQMKCADIARM
jgi:transcription antitermination factor NusG